MVFSYFIGTSLGRTNAPTLVPYPNYEVNHITANETSFGSKIVSVFRLKVDACDRLWFVDTGLMDIIGTSRQVIAPRLFIFDLRTDRLLRQYTFNSSDTSEGTLFGGNIVVDVTANSCNQAFAYIPDFGAYRLVVYSWAENRSWRIRHPYFYFDPFATPFYVGGLTFLWVDGIFGASLSAIQGDGYRTLYFTAISSNHLYAVSTRFLRDSTLAANTSTLLEAYRFLGTRGSNMQTTAHMLDERTGTLFYTLPNRNGIGCWNSVRNAHSYTPLTNTVLATDDVTMIFPNDIVLDDADNVWLLSDRLPVSNMRGLNENEVNFRLFSARISDAIRGTVCEPSRGSHDGSVNFNGPNRENMNNRFGSGYDNTQVSISEKKYETLSQFLKAGGTNGLLEKPGKSGRKLSSHLVF